MTNRTTKREFLFNFFYTVFKRRLSIVMIFFAFFGIVLLGTYLVTPTFEATTKILVHMNPSQQLILFRDLATPSEVNPRINPANNLIQISTGQSVAEEMVRTFGLDRRLQQRREHPTELRDKIKNGLVSLLKSPITLAQNLGLLQRREPNYLADAIEDFIDNVQDVTLEEDTEIVNLTVYWESAELASEMANTMAQLLIQKTKELTQIEASGAYEFTREQVSMAEKSLREAEDELSRFMEREKIVSLVEEKKAELQRLEAFETEYTWTNASSEEVRRQLAEGQENAVSATIIKNSPTIGDLITSLNSLEIRLASLRQEFTDDHPEVLGLKAQIAENSARLDKELDSVLDGLRARK
ncbi:MAG: GumC family protein [bacterium]